MGEEMSGGGDERPAGPDWARIRQEFEGGATGLAELAGMAGLSRQKLVSMARREGWLSRAGNKPKAAPVRATLQRLKHLLQQRLTNLEGQISRIGAEADAAANERDIRAVNTLVRTLEKVLELERKDRAARARRRGEHRDFTDADRQILAERLAGLADGRLPPPPDAAGSGLSPRDH